MAEYSKTEESRQEQNRQEWERPWESGPLRVSENGRYFQCGETPFFWMADTAWLLFHKLTLEESRQYLRNRRELGYNVILADCMHGPGQTNRDGEAALPGGSFREIPSEAGFWKHVDQVLDMAKELGLYVGLLPIWGSSFVPQGLVSGAEMDDYLDFLLERYASYPNLIWIVGGDVRGDADRALFVRMGRKLKEAMPQTLVGYHPFGRTSSSLWFQEEGWLDFHLFQSGHRRYDQVSLQAWDDGREEEFQFGEDNWRYVAHDRTLLPARPVLDGEPSYEEIVQGLHDTAQPYWMAADVRRYAYWSVLSGAAGHTYGHNAVMQFYGDKSVSGAFGVRSLWSEAVHHPGAAQMIFLKRVMESCRYQEGAAAQELLTEEQGGAVRVYSGLCRAGLCAGLYLYRTDDLSGSGSV
ncbi:MAG: DUF4038 domain-containing protein [Eubacteriales bacterium]|nr:DUF4038 domain-containing protein [Eubacteriales bacterium]